MPSALESLRMDNLHQEMRQGSIELEVGHGLLMTEVQTGLIGRVVDPSKVTNLSLEILVTFIMLILILPSKT